MHMSILNCLSSANLPDIRLAHTGRVSTTMNYVQLQITLTYAMADPPFESDA